MTQRIPLHQRSSLQKRGNDHSIGFGAASSSNKLNGTSFPVARFRVPDQSTRPARPVWHMAPANSLVSGRSNETKGRGHTPATGPLKKPPKEPQCTQLFPSANHHTDACQAQPPRVATAPRGALPSVKQAVATGGHTPTGCQCTYGCATADVYACQHAGSGHIDVCVPAAGWQLVLQRSPGRVTQVRLQEAPASGQRMDLPVMTLCQLQHALQRWLRRMEQVKRLLALELGSDVVRDC